MTLLAAFLEITAPWRDVFPQARTFHRAPRDRTELISRTRKDAVLCRRAPEGGRRFYGTEKFTPEQVRQDEAQPWKETKVFLLRKEMAEHPELPRDLIT
jgi:hypothetical protein